MPYTIITEIPVFSLNTCNTSLNINNPNLKPSAKDRLCVLI
ncbi:MULTISPECIES: hypothetical protein [Borreliella]|uniref:Uncharacterized protein n=2 Tax=Borreliella TaxID=64895 RepID=A0A806CMU4_9SPIR|nr:hypothetical protein [Borreliella finlandensis]ACN93357.1 hypothetical protein BSV1_G27 [Borreliella finlandensis]AJY72997.1 hypothetical protein BAFK78_G022 [Borreliella afzelii K78]MBB5141680.1 hypothetical protein [Borreliella afzelii]